MILKQTQKGREHLTDSKYEWNYTKRIYKNILNKVKLVSLDGILRKILASDR